MGIYLSLYLVQCTFIIKIKFLNQCEELNYVSIYLWYEEATFDIFHCKLLNYNVLILL